MDGGYVPWPVAISAPVTIDGGVSVSNFPATQYVVGVVTIDGGVIPVTGSFYPNLQWVAVDGGVMVNNFPASFGVSSLPAVVIDGGVNISSLPAVVIDGGVNVSNFPTVQRVQADPTTPWACGVSPIANQTLTCQAAPGAGSLYLTDYAIWGTQDAGTTLTKGVAAIVWGTGTNCATLDGGIVPTISGAATTMVIGFQANGGTIASEDFTTPIAAPAQTQLCVKCSIPCTAQLNGYTR